MGVFDALQDIAEDVAEFVWWRREWDRKANPVAFWLATLSLFTLVVVLLGWLYAGWQRL